MESEADNNEKWGNSLAFENQKGNVTININTGGMNNTNPIANDLKLQQKLA